MKQTAALRLREIFSNLTGRDGRDDVAKIEAAIERLQSERAAAQQELTALAQERIERLLDDDDAELDRIDRRSEACHRVIERVDEAGLPELQRRLELARDEQQRGRPYKAAQKRVAAAAKKLEARYSALAKELAELLTEIAEVEHEVDVVNRALPIGAEPLQGPERLTRDIPAMEEEILDEETVQRWVFTSTGNMLGDDQASNVIETGRNSGFLESGAGKSSVEKRPFKKVRFHPRESRIWVQPFAEALKLPPLKADEPAFWPPSPGERSAPPREVSIRFEPIERREAAE